MTETVASQGLAHAEAAWDVEVTEMGFPDPLVRQEDGSTAPGLLIVLDPTSTTNHIEAIPGPLGSNACASKLVIPTTSPSSFFEMFVSYGLAVAAENAANCHESPFAYQPSAVAVTVVRWPTESTFLQMALPAFQAHPNQGVNCMFSDAERYFYGAGSALFMLFLDVAYGQGDGTLLGDIWHTAAQDQGNTPNFFTVLTSPLAGATLTDAFVEFARWRYFVGDNDDGLHFPHGAQWHGREVAVDATHSWAELPILAAAPSMNVNELGSAYVKLDLAGSEPDAVLSVAFAGDDRMHWNVDVLLLAADKTAQVHSVLTTPATAGMSDVPEVSQFTAAVLVVSNLGAGEHNPSEPSCDSGATFRYSLGIATPTPGVDDVDKTGSGCAAGASATGVSGFATSVVGLWFLGAWRGAAERRRLRAARTRAGGRACD